MTLRLIPFRFRVCFCSFSALPVYSPGAQEGPSGAGGDGRPLCEHISSLYASRARGCRLPFVWAAGCSVAWQRAGASNLRNHFLSLSCVCSARKTTEGRGSPRLLDRVPQMVPSQLMPDNVSGAALCRSQERGPSCSAWKEGALSASGRRSSALEGAVFSSSLWAARRPGQVSAPRAAMYLPGGRAHQEPGPSLRCLCGWPLQAGLFLEMMMTTRFASHPSYTRQSCNSQWGRLTRSAGSHYPAVDPTFLLSTFRDDQGPLKPGDRRSRSLGVL